MGGSKKWFENKLVFQLISIGVGLSIGGCSIINITLSYGGDSAVPTGTEIPAPMTSHIEPSAPATYSSTESLQHSSESRQESVSSENDLTVISGNSFSGHIVTNNQEDFYMYTPVYRGYIDLILIQITQMRIISFMYSSRMESR